jgi:hypothetical protein
LRQKSLGDHAANASRATRDECGTALQRKKVARQHRDASAVVFLRM